MNRAEFLFLGTGGSSGTPLIGCTCRVCTSSEPHNTRLRPSALITYDNKRLLIDSGPDFRTQALRYHINRLDGVLLTHSHFDHIAGLDELRVYYLLTKQALPVLLSESTYADIKKRYDYLFREKSLSVSLAAQLDFHVLDQPRGITPFLDLQIQYMQYDQAKMPVTGFRFGSLAYISDIQNYPETIFEDLSGIEILILSALRRDPSRMHFSFKEAINFSQKIGALKTYFTHMSHEVDHEETNRELPAGFALGFDGLKLDFQYE